MKRFEHRDGAASSGSVDTPPPARPRPAAGQESAGPIGPAAIEALQKVRNRTSAFMSDADRDDLFARAIDRMPHPSTCVGLTTPVERIASVGDDVRARFGDASRGVFAVAFVAHLALELVPRIYRMGLTPGILDEYPGAFDRLIAQLSVDSLDDYWTGNDFFLKDIRIAGGYSAPCHSVDVDLHGTINRRSGVKALLTQFDVKGGLRMMRHGGTPWYRLHTDTRHLANFNEEGQRHGYLLLADLLRMHPDVRGVTRTSWFFDPRLVEISPHLAHLQKQPVENGAFLTRHGRHPIHTVRSIAKSRTRRRMVASGTYVPEGWSVVWPREELLRWASAHADPWEFELENFGIDRRG